MQLYLLEDQESKAVDHFFHNFLSVNSFSGRKRPYIFDTQSYSQTSSPIFHAVIAIGALWIRRASYSENVSWTTLAFQSYETALKALQSRLQSQGPIVNDVQDLWAILLLGVFELMHERTGQGFQQHMFYGAARAVESCGPGIFRQGPARRFFLELRYFEICRCIVFSQPSFLAKKKWQSLMDTIWADDYVREWRPMEALLDLMVLCSEFAVRYHISSCWEACRLLIINAESPRSCAFRTLI